MVMNMYFTGTVSSTLTVNTVKQISMTVHLSMCAVDIAAISISGNYCHYYLQELLSVLQLNLLSVFQMGPAVKHMLSTVTTGQHLGYPAGIQTPRRLGEV